MRDSPGSAFFRGGFFPGIQAIHGCFPAIAWTLAFFFLWTSGHVLGQAQFQSQSIPGVQNHINHSAVLFDYDADGMLDLFVSTERGQVGQPGYPRSCRLYRNTTVAGSGNVTFQDVTQAAGLLQTTHMSNGAAHGDVDNDGDEDLFVANDRAFLFWPRNWLYRNEGDGTFVQVAASAGVEGGSDNMAVGLVDYDGDGWLDAWTGQHVGRNYLFHNDMGTAGTLVFTEQVEPAIEFPNEATYGMGWADWDLDGDPDCLVANANTGTGTGDDGLLRNDGAAGFTDVTQGSGLNDVKLHGYPSWADFDGDGDLDLYVTNWNDFGGIIAPHGQLYRNDGAGQPFANVTAVTGLGVGPPATEFTPLWGDFDDDGDLDLFVTRGDKNLGNLYLENRLVEDGQAVFLDQTATAGVGDIQMEMGAASGDLDGDDWIDVVITQEQSGLAWMGPRLYRNLAPQPANRAVRLDLQGTVSNLSGLGTRVELLDPAGNQLRFLGQATNTFSSSQHVVHFGTGMRSSVDQVRITWSSGVVQTLRQQGTGSHAFTVVEQGVVVPSMAALGAPLGVDIVGPQGSTWALLLGTVLVPPVPAPPLGGWLQIDLLAPWALAGSGTIPAGNRVSLILGVPSNPNLLGLTLWLQPLLGTFPPASALAWWDPAGFTVN